MLTDGRGPLPSGNPDPFYRDDVVTLYCGDCRALLPLDVTVDHVITDPPYDAKTHAGARRHMNAAPLGIDFAPLADVDEIVPLLLGASRRWIVCFCSLEMLGDYARAAGDRWIRAGFWRRVGGAPQFTGDRPAPPGEGIALMHRAKRLAWNGGGHHAYWERPNVKQASERVHPTQKPLALILDLVEQFTDRGDLVLDPFAGSGTTGVACKMLGRRAILIEQDAAYCAAAARRLAATLDLWPDAVAATSSLFEGEPDA